MNQKVNFRLDRRLYEKWEEKILFNSFSVNQILKRNFNRILITVIRAISFERRNVCTHSSPMNISRRNIDFDFFHCINCIASKNRASNVASLNKRGLFSSNGWDPTKQHRFSKQWKETMKMVECLWWQHQLQQLIPSNDYIAIQTIFRLFGQFFFYPLVFVYPWWCGWK